MKKILLVDDHAPTRLMFSKILAQQGANYEFLEASNGQEACETAHEAKPDLILMDALMPVMDGFEAAAVLSDMIKAAQIPSVPILALTANAMAGDRAKCLSAGCNEYVSKPIKRDVLVALIAAHLPQPVTVST